MTTRLAAGLLASCLLLLGCKDPTDAGSGGTSGTALYAYDSTTSTVFVWTDLGALYDGTSSTATPTKQITSSVFGSKLTGLAWGGMCIDSQRNYLYLVSDTGNIVRVRNLRSQTGSLASTDIDSFALSNTGRLSNSTFGQVALDSQNDTLFITENSSSGTQIWVVNNASTQAQSATIDLQKLQATGDAGGTGVAAAFGSVYGFFLDGDQVGTVTLYSGPRLRKGTSSGWTDGRTLIGDLTLLGKYGSLAMDTAAGYLYVARHNTDAGSSAAPIQVFSTGQFGLAYDQAPNMTLGSPTGQPDLRVIAHGGNKDWLVGLRGQGTVGFGTFYVWKTPRGGTDAKAFTVSPSATVMKGVALDGNAS